MLTSSYGFNAGKVTGNKLTATEWNYLARVLDSQLNGGLSALGVGVIVEDIENFEDSTDLLATGTENEVEVGAGAALCKETANNYGYVVARFTTAQTLTIEEFTEGDNYIYIVPQYAGGVVTLDSRRGDAPTLLVSPDALEDSGDGALLLAFVTLTDGVLGEVEDRRSFISVIALLQRVIQLESDLGYNAEERAKGTVAARLNALSGDEGGAVVTMLSQLKWNATDPRNAIVVIEERLAEILAAALEAAESSGTRDSALETDQIWQWLLSLRRIVGMIAPGLLRYLPGSGAQPGLHGTSSAPDTQQFDLGGTLPAVPEDREYNSS